METLEIIAITIAICGLIYYMFDFINEYKQSQLALKSITHATGEAVSILLLSDDPPSRDREMVINRISCGYELAIAAYEGKKFEVDRPVEMILEEIKSREQKVSGEKSTQTK